MTYVDMGGLPGQVLHAVQRRVQRRLAAPGLALLHLQLQQALAFVGGNPDAEQWAESKVHLWSQAAGALNGAESRQQAHQLGRQGHLGLVLGRGTVGTAVPAAGLYAGSLQQV